MAVAMPIDWRLYIARFRYFGTYPEDAEDLNFYFPYTLQPLICQPQW